MPLQKECCSLELAKQLKELGVEQNSLFYYYEGIEGGLIIYKTKIGYYFENGSAFSNRLFEIANDKIYSAFTSSELGEILPEEIFSDPLSCDSGLLVILKGKKLWLVKYEDVMAFSADTIANAMAKMMIYLREQKLV